MAITIPSLLQVKLPKSSPSARAEVTPLSAMLPTPNLRLSCHKSRAKVHTWKELCCSNPCRVEHFVAPRIRVTCGVSPPWPLPQPWVKRFPLLPFNALMFGQGQRCAGTNGSGDRGQERALLCFYQCESLIPYPESHSCGMPSWGGQGEVAAKASVSIY